MSNDKPRKRSREEILALVNAAPKITKAPPPVPTLPHDTVEALATLNKQSTDDMRKDIDRKRVPVQDYRPVKPEANHWSLEVDWDIQDAAILVVDLDPREGLGKQFKTLLRPDMGDSMATGSLKTEELATFRRIETIVRRATGENSTLPKKHKIVLEDITGYRDMWVATPADFSAWVMNRPPVGVEVPEWMKALVEPSVDYEALIQSLRDSRDRLSGELSEARAEIVRLNLRLAELLALSQAPAQGIVPETLQELQDEWDAAKQKLNGRRPKKTKFSKKSRDTVDRYWDHIKK